MSAVDVRRREASVTDAADDVVEGLSLVRALPGHAFVGIAPSGCMVALPVGASRAADLLWRDVVGRSHQALVP
jgi:hypothetical protein